MHLGNIHLELNLYHSPRSILSEKANSRMRVDGAGMRQSEVGCQNWILTELYYPHAQGLSSLGTGRAMRSGTYP